MLQELKRPEDAVFTVARLLKAVANIHTIDQHEIYVTTSIGVSVYPGDGLDVETLIRKADTAMYHAKKNGSQNYRFFRPEMIVETGERRSMEQDLWHALERKEFALHYQPRIDLKSGAIIGAEALSRWKHPVRGLVPPAQFIPIAEECGLMVPIGAWILREACTQARAWTDAGEPAKMVASIPSQSPKWTPPRVMPSGNSATRQAELKQDAEECEAAQPRWDAVWNRALAAESLVVADRRDYYQAEVLTMITINLESNSTLLLVAKALQDDDAGQTDKAHYLASTILSGTSNCRPSAHAEVNDALHALDTIQESMNAAEYGKWKNWYRGDWLTGVYRTPELVLAYADHLRDPLARLPAPAAWSGWEAYFHIMEYEGDRSVDVH